MTMPSERVTAEERVWLRGLAEKALAETQGPWHYDPELCVIENSSHQHAAGERIVAEVPIVGRDDTARMIAACDPQTVLALLASLEAAGRERDALRAEAERLRGIVGAAMGGDGGRSGP
jgi:hypothetical protein